MILGAGTGVFNLTYYSGIRTNSILTSPDVDMDFPNFYDMPPFMIYYLYYLSSYMFLTPSTLIVIDDTIYMVTSKLKKTKQIQFLIHDSLYFF